MTGIIDAEKLQNEQFIKRDWLVFVNGERATIILNKTEKELSSTVKAFNIAGKIQGLNYTYKQVKITIEVL